MAMVRSHTSGSSTLIGAAGREDAGVDHQQVEAAEGPQGPVQGPVQGVGVGDIAGHAHIGGSGSHLGHLVGQVEADHRRAPPQQLQGARSADARGRAGDQRHLAGQGGGAGRG